MKRLFPSALSLLCLGSVSGQMLLSAGTGITVDEGTTVRIGSPLTWTLEAGSVAINNGNIVLGPSTDLDEAAGATLSGAGTERTTRDLDGPLVSVDPGGLGGIISTDASLGTTLIVRGHLPYTDYSGHSSIARWIDFTPANNNGLDAALDFRYDPVELNGLVETEQRLHIHAGQDIWWPLGGVVNTTDRTVGTSALDSLGLFTTFGQDLPNGLPLADGTGGFILLGAPGEQLWLRVPEGERASNLELFASNGSRITTLNVDQGPGAHALLLRPLNSGIYHLRVNGRYTFTFLHP